MELNKALVQISEIHAQLAKSEIYRGCSPLVVAFTGGFAILGGLLQPWIVPTGLPLAFVNYWVVVALVSFAFVAAHIGSDYWSCASPSRRRATRKILGQFLPCVLAGAILTGLLIQPDASRGALLPGLWAILFSLGIFSCRPYLPRTIGWVALFYLIAGTVLLSLAGGDTACSPWGMAVTFGVGQFLAALAMHINLERKEHA